MIGSAELSDHLLNVRLVDCYLKVGAPRSLSKPVKAGHQRTILDNSAIWLLAYSAGFAFAVFKRVRRNAMQPHYDLPCEAYR
jgi:hypothetical protein